MVWAEKDASSAFDHIRSTADEIFQLLLHVSRPILQHGIPDEATVVGFHFSWVPYAYGWCTAYTKVRWAVKYQRHMFENFNRCIAGDRFVWPHLHPQIFCIEIGPPLYMPCIPISGKVDAFKKAAMHVIELKGYRPKKTGVNALVPNRSTGGRPAYSLLQLYHTFSLKLVIACYFIIFHFVSFCHWLDYCAYYWATDSFLKKLSYRNNKTKSKQWKNTTTIDIKKYQKHWN